MFSFLFGTNGRSGRLEWWLMHILGSAIAMIIPIFIILTMGEDPNLNESADFLLGVSYLMTLIISCWIGVAATIRRYHDRDKTGFWWLISLIPLGFLFVFIECGFFPGTDGVNDYGESQSVASRADLINAGKDDIKTRYDVAAHHMDAGEGRQPVKINRPSVTRFGQRTTTPFGQ